MNREYFKNKINNLRALSKEGFDRLEEIIDVFFRCNEKREGFYNSIELSVEMDEITDEEWKKYSKIMMYLSSSKMGEQFIDKEINQEAETEIIKQYDSYIKSFH
jgi:hypothetical protein